MNRRVALLISFVGMNLMACCCGGCGSREETRKKIDEADALWTRGEKVIAVDKYKAAYHDRFASTHEKEQMLPRIVEFEVKGGNTEEAKKWIKRGLEDKLKAEYTDVATKKLYLTAQRDFEEAQAKAEEERKNKQAKAEEERKKKQEQAAHKAEEEIDSGGLVLMQKTVRGVQNEFGMQITGTVVNRRASKLRYAQITINVYDGSGAQVGSALANINGLESGGRWNFKAVSFTKGTSYKFSELSGF